MNYSPLTVELIPLILTLISTSARSLQMVRLNVPPTTDISDPVTLSCEYNLQGGSLYSVKWYKDENEFFRYMPDYQPHCQAFSVTGISLNLTKSDMNRVTLIDLQFNTSGNYRCEVSTEAPSFKTVAQNSNMTVMAFPKEDPMIEGVLSTYTIGEYVTANCTSEKSNPLPVISWEINNVKAESSVSEYNKGADETDAQGLHSKTVGLKFRIQSEHLNSKERKMEIRCISTVGESVRYKVVYTTITKALTSNQLAQEGFRNSASFSVTSSVNIIFMLITSLHAVYSS